MSDIKLSDAQRALLDDLPCTCVDTYPPGRRLVDMGLAEWADYPLGGTMLRITEEGRMLRRRLTTNPAPEGGEL